MHPYGFSCFFLLVLPLVLLLLHTPVHCPASCFCPAVLAFFCMLIVPSEFSCCEHSTSPQPVSCTPSCSVCCPDPSDQNTLVLFPECNLFSPPSSTVSIFLLLVSVLSLCVLCSYSHTAIISAYSKL